MGFFDLPERDPDDDDAVDAEPDVFAGMEPAAWTAGVVPVELVLARSDEAAVALRGVSAYPDGFTFTVTSYLRPEVPRRRRRRLHHPVMWHDYAEPGDPVPDEFLRFGLAWPDGGRATNIDGWGGSWPDATEPLHNLEHHSGGGSEHQFSQEYWAWPLPDPGLLRLVVEWPAFGIAETTAEIDAALIVDAARRARPVWPEGAGQASHLSRRAVASAMEARAVRSADEES